jgi:hypothetical protein
VGLQTDAVVSGSYPVSEFYVSCGLLLVPLPENQLIYYICYFIN